MFEGVNRNDYQNICIDDSLLSPPLYWSILYICIGVKIKVDEIFILHNDYSCVACFQIDLSVHFDGFF